MIQFHYNEVARVNKIQKLFRSGSSPNCFPTICKFILRLVRSEYLIFHVELWPNMWWMLHTKKGEIIFGKNITKQELLKNTWRLSSVLLLAVVWLSITVRSVLLFSISSRNYEAERKFHHLFLFTMFILPPPVKPNQWRQTWKILPNIQRMSPRGVRDAYQDLNNHNSILKGS